MADLVAPFPGERYAAVDRLSSLIAPPYDVIDPAERLAAWRRDGVLRRDARPTLYVLAQDFTLPTGERLTRGGVFAAVAAEGYEPRRVRPHERTHAGPKADRLALLRATATNIESIFLLAPDRDRTLAN